MGLMIIMMAMIRRGKFIMCRSQSPIMKMMIFINIYGGDDDERGSDNDDDDV